MTSEILNELFERIKCDDVTSVMQIVIQHSWFNIRFPKSINNHFAKDYPTLSHHVPIISIAAFFGSYDVFRFLVANNSDVKLCDDKKMNSIGFAVAGNRVEILECLFDMNAIDPSAANDLLIYACQFNSLDILRLYIDKLDFDINAYDQNGKQCIHYAVLNGSIEMIQLLLDHGANINSATQIDERTPLMLASVINKPDVVKYVLSIEDVDPSLESKFGDNALLLASAPGFIDTIKLLIESNKIDINHQNINGATALHNAVINNKIDAIKYLLQQPDINAEIQDSGKMTPLFRALFLQNKEVMLILRDHIKDLKDSSIIEKNSLVHIATEMNSPEFLEFLINDWKLDVNAEGCTNDRTPLCLAILNSYCKSLEFLLSVPGRSIGKIKPISNYRGNRFPEIKKNVIDILKEHGNDVLEDFEKQKNIFLEEQEANRENQNHH